MASAMRIVGLGTTILTLFSATSDVSKSRMSWVPVPMSIARIRMMGYCGRMTSMPAM
jgi:hypothetical protein